MAERKVGLDRTGPKYSICITLHLVIPPRHVLLVGRSRGGGETPTEVEKIVAKLDTEYQAAVKANDRARATVKPSNASFGSATLT